jgi:hypothetical protein
VGERANLKREKVLRHGQTEAELRLWLYPRAPVCGFEIALKVGGACPFPRPLSRKWERGDWLCEQKK